VKVPEIGAEEELLPVLARAVKSAADLRATKRAIGEQATVSRLRNGTPCGPHWSMMWPKLREAIGTLASRAR